MNAIQLIAHGTPGKFELRSLPEPQPASEEVVVQVQACGLNHLDLWIEAGALPIPVQLPRTPGSEIGGASGVGSAAIQIAKQLGARVISTGSTEDKCTLARQLGAEFVIDSTDAAWPAEIRKITQKRGVDLVVEHVGGEVLQKAFDCLARGGTIVTCGATAGRDVPLNLWPFFVKQQKLVGSYGRNRADLIATLEWAAAGKLKPVTHAIYALDQTPAAFAELRSRSVLGKILVEPFEPISESD